MAKMELEVKVLDINLDEMHNKLISLGATKLHEEHQILHTYDFATTYGRFIEIKYLINNKESEIKYDVAITKLKQFIFDLNNSLTKEEINKILKLANINNLDELLTNEDALNNKDLEKYLYNFGNNSKKWIRLRQSKNKTTIAVKHILKDNNSGIEQLSETEIEVPDIKSANELLEALGFHYKSFQEKKRHSYKLDDDTIEIDIWPGIPPFIEIEAETKEDIERILKKIGYKFEDSISCCVDKIYEIYGLPHFELKEILFKNYK